MQKRFDYIMEMYFHVSSFHKSPFFHSTPILSPLMVCKWQKYVFSNGKQLKGFPPFSQKKKSKILNEFQCIFAIHLLHFLALKRDHNPSFFCSSNTSFAWGKLHSKYTTGSLKKKVYFFFKAKNWLCKNEKIILDFFLLRCVSLGAFYALSKWPNITTLAGLPRGNCPEQQSYMTVKILSTQKATKNKRAFMVVVVAAFCFILSSDCKD